MDIALEQHISKVITCVNDRYNAINYGGCGVFAYYLGETIRQKYDIDVEYVYIKSITPPGKKPDYDVWFKHILVKVGNTVIDNNGMYDICDYSPIEIKQLSREKLSEMITIKDLWNNIYNHNSTPSLVNDIRSWL